MANSAILVALLALTAAMVPNIEAADYTVGGSSGWIVPGSPSFYSDWAAKETFSVGDNLVFNFMAGAHTVARTTKAGYESCDLNAASNTLSTSPANFNLNAAGDYYFICTIPGHCAVGQKLAVTVGASSSPAPNASPAPSSSNSTPPPSEAPSQAQPGTSPAPSQAQSAPPTASPAPSVAPSAKTPAASPAPSESPSAMTPVASPGPSSEAPSAATPEASLSPSGSTSPPPGVSASPSGSEAEPPASSASTLVATFSLALSSAALALFF